MMVSPPASPDGVARSRPQSLMAQSSPEAVKRPRPQSMMHRPSTSTSRPSISSRHENASRSSDDEGRTSVKVGKSHHKTLQVLRDNLLTARKLFVSAHHLVPAILVSRISRSVFKDPWFKSQRPRAWVLIRRKAGNCSSSIVCSGRMSPNEGFGTTFPIVSTLSCRATMCQFSPMDNPARGSHTPWALQARENKVILLPWVSRLRWIFLFSTSLSKLEYSSRDTN